MLKHALTDYFRDSIDNRDHKSAQCKWALLVHIECLVILDEKGYEIFHGAFYVNSCADKWPSYSLLALVTMFLGIVNKQVELYDILWMYFLPNNCMLTHQEMYCIRIFYIHLLAIRIPVEGYNLSASLLINFNILLFIAWKEKNYIMHKEVFSSSL